MPLVGKYLGLMEGDVDGEDNGEEKLGNFVKEYY